MDSQTLFIEQISELIKKHSASYGIKVNSPIIAQAILESAYGRSELAKNAHNYFGLKYRKGRCKTCIGIYTKVGSEQNADSSYVSQSMQWCKFKSMEDGVIGYFDFINISHYSNLKGISDPETYLNTIKADGYATSLSYVKNLMAVIKKWDLTKYDKEEKKMSNSSLVSYTKLSPNHSGTRTHSIDRITPHCVVGQLTAEGIAACFPAGREASCNYGIGRDGRIALIVEEKNRSWCSSSNANDQRAVTIECASDRTHPYAMTDAVYNSLINLCVDICKRNGKNKLIWFGDKNRSLNYNPGQGEMVLTVHRWFANKACPGDWLYSKLSNLATEVTKRLGGASQPTPSAPSSSGTLYRVQTGAFRNKSNADSLNAKLKADGFDTCMVSSGDLYKVQVGAYSKKENAEAQMNRLKAKGYDAFITMNGRIAASASPAPTKKSNTEIAREIIRGTCSDSRWSTWGNGTTRVERLKAAGYDPSAVQKEVNRLL